MSNAKYCQSHTQHTQSSSSSRSKQQHSCSSSRSSNRINSYTLIMTLAALMLPLAHARHLPDQLALGFEYDDVNSGIASSSASSSSSSSSGSNSGSQTLWHANPFYGLSQSFGDAGYDSDADSSSSSNDAESEISFEEITQAAVRAAMREVQRQQIRHRRSHNLKYFKPTASGAPEWENPCSGNYYHKTHENFLVDMSTLASKEIKRQALLTLKNNTLIEYKHIGDNINFESDNIQPWKGAYSFLANMTKPIRSIKLKTWYSNMQVFIGSFAYLGKAHYKYRYDHQLPLDTTTNELNELLFSARRVLCEIETAINATFPNSNGSKLNVVSKAAMQERLKFYTPANGSKEADLRDLKFTKQLYYHFLDNMWKSLKVSMRRQGRKSKERRLQLNGGKLVSGSNSGSSFNSRQLVSMESSESTGSAEQQRRKMVAA